MILYVVRHGETDANVQKILQGPLTDGLLNEKGVLQMEQLTPELPSGIEVIYISPRKRVQQSAEILNKRFNVKILTREELTERNFGSLVGRSFQTMEDGNRLRELDENQQYDYRPFGGESAEDVAKRTQHFLDEICVTDYEHVLVVTSRGAIRMFYKLLGKAMQDVPNGSLHIFEI